MSFAIMFCNRCVTGYRPEDLRMMKVESGLRCFQNSIVQIEGPYCSECVFMATEEIDLAGQRVLETVRVRWSFADDPTSASPTSASPALRGFPVCLPVSPDLRDEHDRYDWRDGSE